MTGSPDLSQEERGKLLRSPTEVLPSKPIGHLPLYTIDAVRSAGLPFDPDDFVVCIAGTWFDENHPAHLVIAAAFGERVQRGGR